MALYTEAQILSSVRSILQEPVALFWTDTQLTDYMNWAARTISGVTLCTPATDTLAAADSARGYVAGGLSITMETKFIRIEDVTQQNSAYTTLVHLQRLDIRNFGHGAPAAADTNQEPQWYYAHGQELFLWPCIKGTMQSAGAVTVYEYKAAESYLHDTTAYDIPDRLQAVVLDFVLSCAYAKAGKYSLSRYHMSRFMQKCITDRRDVHDVIHNVVDSMDAMRIPDRSITPQ